MPYNAFAVVFDEPGRILNDDAASTLRAGFVQLAAGEGCGRHTTGAFEELLVFIEGQGEVEVEGHGRLEVSAPAAVFIPTRTWHEVWNTGGSVLKYVYVVAQAE